MRTAQVPQASPGVGSQRSALMAAASANADSYDELYSVGNAGRVQQAGGDMARLAAILRPLVQGERDADKLTEGMSAEGEKLVLAILEELGKLDRH